MFGGNCCQDGSDWANFVSELTDRQEVCVQLFQRYTNTIFSDRHECWILYRAKFQDMGSYVKVRYNGEQRSCSRAGLLTFGVDSDLMGDCFPGRIVKWSTELGVLMGDRKYLKSCRPIYEPEWGEVAVFFEKSGPGSGNFSRTLDNLGLKNYQYSVNGGTVYKAFATYFDNEIKSIPEFVYTERLST